MAEFILGLDPGFASIGYAVCRLSRGEGGERVFQVQRMGLLETQKSSKKRDVRAVEDNVRRCREIAADLNRLFVLSTWGRVRAICAESMSFPRNASAAAKVALTWGVISTLSELHGIPLLQATPQEVKQAVTKRKDASKEDVRAALESRFGASLADRVFAPDGSILTSKTKWEHPYDALGSAVSCLSSDVIRGLWS